MAWRKVYSVFLCIVGWTGRSCNSSDGELAKAFEDFDQQSEMPGKQRYLMSERKETTPSKSSDDKSQELVPPGRERIHEGQQFDEMQRQHKNPDDPRDEDES